VLALVRRCPFPRILVISHERLLQHLLATAEGGLHVVPTLHASDKEHGDFASARATANNDSGQADAAFGLCGFRGFALGGWTSVFDNTDDLAPKGDELLCPTLGFALHLNGLRIVHFLSSGASLLEAGHPGLGESALLDSPLLPEGIAQVSG
jgi:hypothetical protein